MVRTSCFLFSLLKGALIFQCLALIAITPKASLALELSRELIDEVKKSSIVWLKDNVDEGKVSQIAKQFSEASKVSVIEVYPALKAFSISMPPDAAEVFLSDKTDQFPDVEGIGADLVVIAYDESECTAPTSPSDHGLPPNIARVVGTPSGDYSTTKNLGDGLWRRQC